MNKKILMLTITLLAVSMIAIPTVSACRNRMRKTSASYIVVTDIINTETVWEKLIPSEDNPQKEFEIAIEHPTGMKVNIGGELVPSTIPDVYEIVGGTTYVLGTDFTYEGTEYIMIDFDVYPVPDIVRFTVMYSYTFLPASGIEGKINLFARCYYDFDAGVPTGGGGKINGYGTGDLRGVVVKAEWGPPILDPEWGVKVITHEGTIRGFPVP